MIPLAFMVTSCARSIPVTELPQPMVDESLKIECADPVQVPKRVLTKAEIVGGWNVDRSELRKCKAKHGAIVGQIDIINDEEH